MTVIIWCIYIFAIRLQLVPRKNDDLLERTTIAASLAVVPVMRVGTKMMFVTFGLAV